jgi:hypothetical protein
VFICFCNHYGWARIGIVTEAVEGTAGSLLTGIASEAKTLASAGTTTAGVITIVADEAVLPLGSTTNDTKAVDDVVMKLSRVQAKITLSHLPQTASVALYLPRTPPPEHRSRAIDVFWRGSTLRYYRCQSDHRRVQSLEHGER